MLYYAKVNGRIIGPLALDELVRMREDSSFGADDQWCPADSEIWMSPEAIDLMVVKSESSWGEVLLPICDWGLLLLTPLFFLLQLDRTLCTRPFFVAFFFLYATGYAVLIVTRKIRWMGFLFYGFMLCLIGRFALTLNDAPPVEVAASEAAVSEQPARPAAPKLPWNDPQLPYIVPLDFPEKCSEKSLELYAQRTPTSYCGYPKDLAPLAEIFTRHNDTDTLTVERARYFADNISTIPYKREAGWQNLFETLKSKEGNCGAKSIALYDMMMRAGAKNVFWVVGVSYDTTYNVDPPIYHAWVYWEKEGKRYIIECTAYTAFDDIDNIRSKPYLAKYYSARWPLWGISDGKCYVFGK